MTIPPERPESPAQRADRHLGELLAELRVTLPGVQVLLAFLLIVPFNARWDTVSDFQRSVYVVALLGSAVSTTLLMAPTAIHRLRFGRGQKEDVVRVSHVLALAGLAVLGLSMTAAVLLVADLILTTPVALAMAGGLLAFIVAVWVVLPLSRLRRP